MIKRAIHSTLKTFGYRLTRVKNLPPPDYDLSYFAVHCSEQSLRSGKFFAYGESREPGGLGAIQGGNSTVHLPTNAFGFNTLIRGSVDGRVDGQ
jgi:hypothetical protein